MAYARPPVVMGADFLASPKCVPTIRTSRPKFVPGQAQARRVNMASFEDWKAYCYSFCSYGKAIPFSRKTHNCWPDVHLNSPTCND